MSKLYELAKKVNPIWTLIIFVVSALFAAADIDPNTMNTWPDVYNFLVTVVLSPKTIAVFAMAVMVYLTNARTPGVGK